MMKKKLTTLFICLLLLFTITSCQIKQNIKNNIENEITNRVVNYEEITIKDLENAVETAYQRVENAVIGVCLKKVNTLDSGVTSEDGLDIGSGVIYKAEEVIENDKLVNYKYYAMTNRHVVIDTKNELSGTTKVYVTLGEDGPEVEAKILGYDEKVDLALITFYHYTKIQPVEFADSNNLKKGSFVIAVGHPEGYTFYNSVTFGVVSGNARYISSDTDGDGVNDFVGKYIQHDAAINPGNSGGGLFTLEGKLVGMNTMKYSSVKVENMGFAITSNEIKYLLENYLEKEINIERPRLGLTGIQVKGLTPTMIQNLGIKSIPDIYTDTETKYGIYVTEISKGSSSDNSGISPDDIILEFNGNRIKTMTDLSIMLSEQIVGNKIEITYYSRKNNKILTTTITLKK
ncbi:MAG: trypsin-like peptidase domain-containing protein [Bacilli bacterium]|nr:trypsin-like peptidase domain-containing protein [Bacilli bacterium]